MHIIDINIHNIINLTLKKMTEKELALLRKALMQSQNYLEFGSGNSTLLATEIETIKHITVVESDASFWNEKLLNIPSIKCGVYTKRIKPLLINIGPTGEWGYPIDNSNQNQWPLYSSSAFHEKTSYDLVLVDGRFRVACILQACLHCSPETRIMIHDFFNRPIYFAVCPFLKLEEQADTLGIFTINKRKNSRILKEYISIYEKLPGF